jgi:predicted nucleic acid-binding protein
MRWYLDASVALHTLLPTGNWRAHTWLDGRYTAGDKVFASTLLELEVIRALRRDRLDPGVASSLLRRVTLVSLEDSILHVAARIEPHVKTLDAIHLATCSILGYGVTLVSHDAGMIAAATALGIDHFDPIAGE